jgi:hypothetical protein
MMSVLDIIHFSFLSEGKDELYLPALAEEVFTLRPRQNPFSETSFQAKKVRVMNNIHKELKSCYGDQPC